MQEVLTLIGTVVFNTKTYSNHEKPDNTGGAEVFIA